MSPGLATSGSARVLHPAGGRQVTLIDVLDRLLQGGVVIQAEIMLTVANIDLVALDLRLLVAAASRLANG